MIQPPQMPGIDGAQVKEFAEQLIGWAVLATVPVAAIWFTNKFYSKKFERWVEGRRFHKDRMFELDEEIMVDDVPSRLVRYDNDNTTFYQYALDRKNGIPIFADRLVVANDKLRDLKITKQIPNHSRSTKVRPITH